MSGPELAGAGLDPQDFSQAVASLPNCRVLSMDLTQPTAAQEEQVRTFLGQDQALHPVLLVAKDPEYRGASVARLLRDELRLNPEYLLPVDLTVALENREPAGRSAKGLEMIRQAASQASLANPIVSQEIVVNRHILVWGDSFAALQAARDLAEAGYPVTLASPNPELQPLPWEFSEKEDRSDASARLIQEVREHQSIKIVCAARIKHVDGVAGNFSVRLDSCVASLSETVGAIILAPELQLKAVPQPYNFPSHPEVIPLTSLEALPDFASEADIPDTVVILLGLAGESHPLALERTLKASSRLLAAGSRVYLLVGSTKVAGPALQRTIQESQDSGLMLIKLNDCPKVSVDDDGIKVEFLEPSIRENLSLKADLVVYDEQYQAAQENAALAELLRLPGGPGSFLQSGNVHHAPVATPRRGIYVAGPGRGIVDQKDTATDINAIFNDIQDLLGQGRAVALQGRSEVDRGKCVFCLTCYRLCPHGAITWDNRAIINELACQGCGICASACPNDAIQVRNYTDDQVAAQMETFDPNLTPRIVAFMCRNSAWEAYQAAVKLHAASLPSGFTPIKVPCAGKVDPDYLMQAFTAGADGVLVMSCPQDNCKSTHGNQCAEWGVEQTRELLAEVGIDPGRLLFNSLAANAPGDFIDSVDELMANLRHLKASTDEAFPVWLTTGMTYREHHTVPRVYTAAFESQEKREVLIEINAADAQNLGIRSGEQLKTAGREGSVTATAVITNRVRPGTAFLPRNFLKDALDLLLGGAAPAGAIPSYDGLAVNLEKITDRLEEVFGIKVMTSRYLHRGHTWLALEAGGRVRLGMDDFSQKLFGTSDDIKLPVIGQEIRRDKVEMALARQGATAGVLAPVVGIIEEVNHKVLNRPGLTHDDPYGEGWMMLVAPTNLRPDLENLVFGEASAAFIEEETSRLLAMLEPSVGATLQAGGSLIDDVYAQCPELGWDRLVKEFLRSA
jgi:coenzyme F420-reducing hydrogenase delta subunit/glycine cleavage system H lipoate-binding protein/Pyruvate/2-oxoacid:ferredoxin oxidoreductase delta subunit